MAPSDIPVPKGPRGTEGFQETLEILVPEVKWALRVTRDLLAKLSKGPLETRVTKVYREWPAW